MPLFGAAFAAPNKGTTVLFRFRSLSTVLIPTENRRIRGLFMTFVWFPVLFKAYLFFKDFSRKPSKFKYFSSLCEPCCKLSDTLMISLKTICRQTRNIQNYPACKYSKTCLKQPLSKRPQIGFQDQLSLIAGQIIANAPLGAFCNTFDHHEATICL